MSALVLPWYCAADTFAATWVPFFDDVDAIIFLAPISAFDQALAVCATCVPARDSLTPRAGGPFGEPPRGQRAAVEVDMLEPAARQGVSRARPVLLPPRLTGPQVDLILFLNKCDMLARKLEAGVRLSKYVRSFGERSNDVETASQCACALPPAGECANPPPPADFKSKFQAIQREYSPQPRRFYGYATSVTVRPFPAACLAPRPRRLTSPAPTCRTGRPRRASS